MNEWQSLGTLLEPNLGVTVGQRGGIDFIPPSLMGKMYYLSIMKIILYISNTYTILLYVILLFYIALYCENSYNILR